MPCRMHPMLYGGRCMVHAHDEEDRDVVKACHCDKAAECAHYGEPLGNHLHRSPAQDAGGCAAAGQRDGRGGLHIGLESSEQCVLKPDQAWELHVAPHGASQIGPKQRCQRSRETAGCADIVLFCQLEPASEQQSGTPGCQLPASIATTRCYIRKSKACPHIPRQRTRTV